MDFFTVRFLSLEYAAVPCDLREGDEIQIILP